LVEAGPLPVNSWLPLAHPVAPTNVSALLSAVIVNLGIYGIMRFNLDLHPTSGSIPGLIVLIVGSLSALIGILYATVRAETKRLLAHSTIENRGIVAAGIGAANDIPGVRPYAFCQAIRSSAPVVRPMRLNSGDALFRKIQDAARALFRDEKLKGEAVYVSSATPSPFRPQSPGRSAAHDLEARPSC
jgi:NADH:ubiquinone oxidoreductase subunit 2 (subunit N)